MKYLRKFNENTENIIGYFYNPEDYDEDIPEDLYTKAEKLANNRGIRILSGKDLLYAFYDINSDNVIAALFVDPIGDYSFDIVVDVNHEKSGYATKLVEIAIGDYEIYKEADEDLIMKIDCINPIMGNLLERKFGFKEIGRYIHGRRIMARR